MAADNWRIGWVTIAWDGRSVSGGVDPVCDVCGEMVVDGIGMGPSQGVLWEHAATGGRTLRCGRPACLVPPPPDSVSDLAWLAVERLRELAMYAHLAVQDGRAETAAALLHRVHLMADAARVTLQVDTGKGERPVGDLYSLLWSAPWSADADSIVSSEYLAAYDLHPIEKRTLVGYLHSKHAGDAQTLAYWVSRVMTVDAMQLGWGLEDAQTPLPFDSTDPSNLPGGA